MGTFGGNAHAWTFDSNYDDHMWEIDKCHSLSIAAVRDNNPDGPVDYVPGTLAVNMAHYALLAGDLVNNGITPIFANDRPYGIEATVSGANLARIKTYLINKGAYDGGVDLSNVRRTIMNIGIAANDSTIKDYVTTYLATWMATLPTGTMIHEYNGPETYQWSTIPWYPLDRTSSWNDGVGSGTGGFIEFAGLLGYTISGSDSVINQRFTTFRATIATNWTIGDNVGNSRHEYRYTSSGSIFESNLGSSPRVTEFNWQYSSTLAQRNRGDLLLAMVLRYKQAGYDMALFHAITDSRYYDLTAGSSRKLWDTELYLALLASGGRTIDDYVGLPFTGEVNIQGRIRTMGSEFGYTRPFQRPMIVSGGQGAGVVRLADGRLSPIEKAKNVGGKWYTLRNPIKEKANG